jgi:hypothetical protein
MTTTFCGLLGAAIPAVLGLRLGRQLPIYVSFVVIVIMGSAALYTNNATVYSLGLAGYTFGFAVAVPYIFGFSTLLGRTGAVTSALGAMIVGGHSIGPAIAGYIVEAGGFSFLAVSYLTMNMLAFICLLMCFLAISRRSREFVPQDVGHA